MKRLPLVASFVLFLLLCASTAYWGMQIFKPPLRPVAAPPAARVTDIRPEVADVLFGGRGKVAVASNYQLNGVVMAGSARESVAILSANGKPAQAVATGKEVVPGVTVKEVHRDYVLLSEGGVIKRVELPESAKGQANLALVMPADRQATPTVSTPTAAHPPTSNVSQTMQTPAGPVANPTLSAPVAGGTPQQQPSAIQAAPGAMTTAPPTVVVSPPPSSAAARQPRNPVTPVR